MGHKFEEGTCFFNKKAGAGGCIQPCPKVMPANLKVWELFEDTWDAGNYRGMDGDPAGRHFCCVESAARALGVRWDRRNFKKFKLILDVWQWPLFKKITERNKGRKVPGKK